MISKIKWFFSYYFKEKEDWNKFRKECEEEKKEFLDCLYNLYEKDI